MENYKSPDLEESVYQLADTNVSSKLDATKSFWSVYLDHGSSLLMTFMTHSGHFYANHWFENFTRCLPNEEGNDHKTCLVMSATHDDVAKINSSKCEIKRPSIMFMAVNLPIQVSHRILPRYKES